MRAARSDTIVVTVGTDLRIDGVGRGLIIDRFKRPHAIVFPSVTSHYPVCGVPLRATISQIAALRSCMAHYLRGTPIRVSNSSTGMTDHGQN